MKQGRMFFSTPSSCLFFYSLFILHLRALGRVVYLQCEFVRVFILKSRVTLRQSFFFFLSLTIHRPDVNKTKQQEIEEEETN
jgi:hypothetical protein